jgi:hypothetical protein
MYFDVYNGFIEEVFDYEVLLFLLFINIWLVVDKTEAYVDQLDNWNTVDIFHKDTWLIHNNK